MMNNNVFQKIQKLRQFMNTYNGNPQQEIQQMLNSGKVSQTQYDAAVKEARQIAQMMGVPYQ